MNSSDHGLHQNDPRAENSADEFSRGTLDVVRQLCAALIGRGVLKAEDLHEDVERLLEFWVQRGNNSRAEPVRILREALIGMAKAKRAADADIFPAPRSMN